MFFANSNDRAGAIAKEIVEAASVDPQNEGKLVMVFGTPELADGGVLADEETDLTVKNALYYGRIPMQKVYAERTREVVVDKGEDKVSAVDDVTKTEHYVVETWINADQSRAEVIDSTAVRYENPKPVNLSAYHKTGDLRVAGFKVSTAEVIEALTSSNHGFTPDELAKSCGEYITRSELPLVPTVNENGNGILSTGNDIGDVQVSFTYETLDSAEAVTIIGRQKGDTLTLEDDDVVSMSEHVHLGKLTKDEFLSDISDSDATDRKIAIGFIVVGAVLLIFSLGFIRRR